MITLKIKYNKNTQCSLIELNSFNLFFIKGVKQVEMMIALTVCQLLALIIQTGFLYFFLIQIFKIQCKGSLPLAIIISIFPGVCGIFEGTIKIQKSFKNIKQPEKITFIENALRLAYFKFYQ